MEIFGFLNKIVQFRINKPGISCSDNIALSNFQSFFLD